MQPRVLNIDLPLDEIRKILNRGAVTRVEKLRHHKQRRLAHSVNELYGKNAPSRIISDDASNFLLSYGDSLIATIHELTKSFDPREALFVLARLPWMPSGSRSGVTNALRLARAILMGLPYPNSDKQFKAPVITEELVDRVILFEDLCADLHGTQSVYRTLEKVRFFEMQRVLELQQHMFRVIVTDEVEEAINSYNARSRRGGVKHWAHMAAPSSDDAFSPYLYTLPSHNGIPQPPLFPEEQYFLVVDPNFPKGWPFICLNSDPIARLRDMQAVIDFDRLEKDQQDALGELIYAAAVREQLYDIRREHIKKLRYGYDIERKGYIKLEWSSMLEGLKIRVERISRGVLTTALAEAVTENLKEWIQNRLARRQQYPTTIAQNWEFPLFTRVDENYVFCFPDILEHIEIEAHNKLNTGGVVGTKYYGAYFETHVKNYLRQSGIEQYGWDEWKIDRAFVDPQSGQNIAQVDFACYRGTTLFVVDAKSSPSKVTLDRADAKRDWRDTKKRLDGAISTAEKLVKHWSLLDPVPPSGIRHLIPIACTPLPVFSKVRPPYRLYTIKLEKQLDQQQESVAIPMICTVEELAEVLAVFDIDEYLASGGTAIPIGGK